MKIFNEKIIKYSYNTDEPWTYYAEKVVMIWYNFIYTKCLQ